MKIERLVKISSSSVQKHTKKNWDQWVLVLDQAGAHNWTHQEIVKYLVKKYKLSLWWQQMVTSGYEVHIGRKVEGRNSKGEYSTVASKTYYISGLKMWKLLMSEKGLQAWLKPLGPFKVNLKAQFESEGGIYGEIRTMLAPTRIRFTWQEAEWEKASVAQMYVIGRNPEKCFVVFQHDKIKDVRTKNEIKQYWKGALENIENLCPKKPLKKSSKTGKKKVSKKL